jgi:DNA-binding NtrC family response regulator
MADVLLVEDDTVSRVILTHVLTRLGHGVVATEDLATARLAAAAATFDVVLADYDLPDGPGLDLIELTAPTAGRTRFVLVTGHSHQDDLDDVRAGDADAYLTKPVASRTLADCMERLLPGRAG